jgi:hypothetical protein
VKAKAEVKKGRWTDLLTGKPVEAAKEGRLRVRLPALSGTTFVLTAER